MPIISREPTEYELGSSNLFKPFKLGKVQLQNRIFFPPTTRGRSTIDGVPTKPMLEYYSDRAKENGGLIITEGTFISPGASGFPYAPGIWSEQQAKAWKIIVDAIHENGTAACVQFWNLGRTADASELKRQGQPLVAPSLVYPDAESERKAIEAGNPLRELTLQEIEIYKKDYVKAAKNAVEIAGFDFIEIHDAHGYFFDQFLLGSSNKRADKYGGSIENRARFVLETIDLLIEAIGADKIGVRFSPWATFSGMLGVDEEVHPMVQVGYVLSELNKRKIAYVSVAEPRVNGNASTDLSQEILEARNNRWVSQIFQTGAVLRAGNYLHDREDNFKTLRRHVNENDKTLFGFSRYFTSNPDLIQRLKNGWELAQYDRSHFYDRSNYRYSTWPPYGEAEPSPDDPKAKEEFVPLA